MNIDEIVLESKYPEFQWCVKGPLQKVWKDGFPVDEQKILMLYFDRYLCEVADMIRDQEWTDEDKLYAERALDRFLNDPNFRDAWVHEMPKPAMPWPTYDQTHHNQVAVVAAATGQVGEALMYEQRGREGGPRESVVKKLQALLSDTPVDEPVADTVEAEAELGAVY